MKHIETSTLAERNTHNLWSYRRADLQWNRCRHNENGKPGWEPSIQLSGRNDNNETVFGSWGRLRQSKGEEGRFTLWRLFFKVWQLQSTSEFEYVLFKIFPYFPKTPPAIFSPKRFPVCMSKIPQHKWGDSLRRDNLSGRAHAQYVCVRLCLCTTFHPQAYSQSHFGRVMAQTWLKLPFISRRTTLKRGYFGWKYYALIRKARVLYQVIYVKEKV